MRCFYFCLHLRYKPTQENSALQFYVSFAPLMGLNRHMRGEILYIGVNSGIEIGLEKTKKSSYPFLN
jgi:hypothetical protein